MVNPTTPPVPTSIAGLPSIPIPPSGSDYIPVSQNGVTYKAAANTLGGTGPAGPVGPAGTVVPWAVATGTANAILAAYTPAVTNLTDGLLLSFRATAANSTTTPTFKADGTLAHTVTDLGGGALVANAIPGALAECLVRYNLANTHWELMNPANTSTGVTTTGSPSSGNITKFSGSSTITNTDLTGDITTSGGVATTLATVNTNVGTFVSTTVNGKGLVTAAGNLTGDVTSSGAATTLATVNSNVGTFASVTVNGKGLVTAAANLTGDVTSSSAATTLATVNSNVGSFTNANITVNGKGLITAAANGTAALMTALAVGSIILARNNVGSGGAGSTLAAGATAAAANLIAVRLTGATTASFAATGDTLSGTWQTLEATINAGNANGDVTPWQRTV